MKLLKTWLAKCCLQGVHSLVEETDPPPQIVTIQQEIGDFPLLSVVLKYGCKVEKVKNYICLGAIPQISDFT